MAGVEKRDFDSPDESRTPAKTRSDIVHLGGTTAARLTLEPGWRWSDKDRLWGCHPERSTQCEVEGSCRK